MILRRVAAMTGGMLWKYRSPVRNKGIKEFYRDTKLMRDKKRGIHRGHGVQVEEITKEILGILKERSKAKAIDKAPNLPPKLRELVALSSVLATQQERDKVTACVQACLKSGATPQEVMQVVNQVILMAEIPASFYRSVVTEAIKTFCNA
jgi:alkylhydroperoxidase/carboxymuconolactone decarboxylase family protein YurZ